MNNRDPWDAADGFYPMTPYGDDPRLMVLSPWLSGLIFGAKREEIADCSERALD